MTNCRSPLFLLLLAGSVVVGEEPRAISADTGPVGELLRRWAAEGAAAGNTGDAYDNRDGAHSDLDLKPFPQLDRITYSEEDKKANRHWAVQREVLPRVVFGNSSTSASPQSSGSNARQAYCSPGGLELLARQYRGNNLYIYPEHRDHDAPTAGEEGYGDLFPTNSPYVVISQGSSGSDQPFMRAVPSTLAAFRPDVKAKLVEKGLLMPAVQMILRMTSKPVQTPADYLTGKAHPTVFDGAHVDARKMAELAHEITMETLPPMVQLRLVEAEPATPGRDYFDAAPSESLAETECVIARVYRSGKASRRLLVSAENSFDVNGRPLAFHWVLLRGDPAQVTITAQNEAKSVAEITVRYHPRAPIAAGAALESNRVEIGVFVHNGAHFSAPGFVTSFSLANEGRSYDGAGRLLEVGYGIGATEFRIGDWTKFFATLRADTPATRLLRGKFTAEQLEGIVQLVARYEPVAARAGELEKAKNEAEAALKIAEPDRKGELETAVKVAREARDKATKERDALLDQTPAGLGAPLKRHLPEVLRALSAPLTFYVDRAREFGPLPSAVEPARKRLAALAITKDAGDAFELLLLVGDGPAIERFSAYQQAELGRFHGELLAALLPGVQFEYRRNLVDFRLTLPKTWRDVYEQSDRGETLGWTRYEETGTRTEFAADGLVVLTRDALGRPLTATPVAYGHSGDEGKRRPWEWPPIGFKPRPGSVRYAYASDSDQIGRAVPMSLDETSATEPATQ